MAFNLLDQFNRPLNTIFAAGNAGIVTKLIDGTGADIGSQFAAGNSGITTGLHSSAGPDIGSLFAAIGGGISFGASISPGSYNGPLQAAGAHSLAPFTCNTSNATGTVTYSWTVTGSVVTLTNATTATPTLNYTVPTHGGQSSAFTLTCTVHDSGTGSTKTPTASFTYTGPP